MMYKKFNSISLKSTMLVSIFQHTEINYEKNTPLPKQAKQSTNTKYSNIKVSPSGKKISVNPEVHNNINNIYIDIPE